MKTLRETVIKALNHAGHVTFEADILYATFSHLSDNGNVVVDIVFPDENTKNGWDDGQVYLTFKDGRWHGEY